MKELGKILGMALIVLLAVIIVAGSQGEDELNFGSNKEEEYTEENYSYNIVSSPENGQYKNKDNSNMYAMLGKNSNGTYRLYFIKTLGLNKSFIVKIDDLEVKSDGSGSFKNNANKTLIINISNKSFTIKPLPQTTGDSEIEGTYEMMHSIKTFSANEFKFK